MDGNQSFGERLSGLLILGILAILVVVGSQQTTIKGLFVSATEPGIVGSAFMVDAVVTPTAVLPTTTTDSPSQSIDSQPTTLSLPVVGDGSLEPMPNPRTLPAAKPTHQFVTYQIQSGDTPNIIADLHGISPETLLGGNPWLTNESSLLQTGVEVTILPTDGLLHRVAAGETLEAIATQYGVSVADIIAYQPNNLTFPYRLYPQTELLIPGAVLDRFQWSAPKSVGNSNNGATKWAVVGSGSFNWPVSGRCVTSYYWYGHPGLDISTAQGSAVTAADTGTVTYASWASGSYYDYGNLIVINHGNGFETFYAHLSSIGVYPGQIVNKGEWIGATGNTGRSSGPHIHIEIRLNDARLNPLSYLFGSTQNCTGN